jgi:hypothetical protein
MRHHPEEQRVQLLCLLRVAVVGVELRASLFDYPSKLFVSRI